MTVGVVQPEDVLLRCFGWFSGDWTQVFFKKDREGEDSGVVLDIGCGHGSSSRLFATLYWM